MSEETNANQIRWLCNIRISGSQSCGLSSGLLIFPVFYDELVAAVVQYFKNTTVVALVVIAAMLSIYLQFDCKVNVTNSLF